MLSVVIAGMRVRKLADPVETQSGSMPTLRRKRGESNTPPPCNIEVKLRRVVPVIPDKEQEKNELMEDLTSMGCLGLAEKPWGFKEAQMVKELVGERSNQFDNINLGDSARWTEELWRSVYRFRHEGYGMVRRSDNHVQGRFHGSVNSHDGYAVEDCIDDRHRRLLQFLVPVLHPEKPTRVTVTLGNTIFGALTGNRKVDWGRILSDLVSQLVIRIGRSRATPLSPYLFHLYKHQQLLTNMEEKTWRT